MGHFGGKDKDNWFLAWADDKDDAFTIVDKMFGEPIFIEELHDVSSGAICINTIDISDDDEPFYFLEALPDDLKFKNDEYIQKLIRKEKCSPTDAGKKHTERDVYRKSIEIKNDEQKKNEEEQYQIIKERLDNIKSF